MIKVITHQGLGDNIYARPFVEALARRYRKICVETPFPELYSDEYLFSKPQTKLLPTQQKNVDEKPIDFWTTEKKFEKTITLISNRMKTDNWSITEGLQEIIQQHDAVRFLPPANLLHYDPNPGWAHKIEPILQSFVKPVCLVKLPTQRKDFNLPARNPHTRYFQLFIENNPQYTYINITQENESEWLEDYVPEGIDCTMELNLHAMIGAVDSVDMVLCPPSFMLPLSLALHTNCVCIFGGYCHPELLLDPRIDRDRLCVIAPDPFCHCLKANHNCKKEIDERLFKGLCTPEKTDLDCW
jgi:hypothetical protein